MFDYRARLRALGLRPVQIWLPDTRGASFAVACRMQAEAIAKQSASESELQQFVEDIGDWAED